MSTPNLPRIGDLEVEQNLPFQRLCWRLERWAWVGFTLILLAALAGLLGPGPLSNTTAGDRAGPLWAEYQRFGRMVAPEELRLHADPRLARDGRLTLWIAREYLDLHQIEQVTPPPERVDARPDAYGYVFNVAQPTTPGPISITFNLSPERTGTKQGHVHVDGAAPLDFRQFVYP